MGEGGLIFTDGVARWLLAFVSSLARSLYGVPLLSRLTCTCYRPSLRNVAGGSCTVDKLAILMKRVGGIYTER